MTHLLHASQNHEKQFFEVCMSTFKSIDALDVVELLNLAEHPDTHDDVLVKIAHLNKPYINMSLAKREPLSQQLFSALINADGEKDRYVMLSLMDNKSLGINHLQAVIDTLTCSGSNSDTIERCLTTFYERPDVPRALLIEGARSNIQGVQMSVLSNVNADEHVISILAESENDYVVNAVAKSNKTPISILHLLSKSEILFIRESVASNENSDHEILAMLANDDLSVSSRVAKNISAQPDLLESMFSHGHQFIKQYIAANLKCPLNIMNNIASMHANDSLQYNAMLALANNMSAPIDILDRLLLKKNDKIVEAVVQNRSYVANENTIKCLTRVPDFSISARMNLAGNISTPLYVMLKLLTVEDTPLVKNVMIDAIQKSPDSKYEALYDEGWTLESSVGHDDKLQTLESLLRDCKLFDAIDKLLALELKHKIEAASDGQSPSISKKINRCI